MSSTHRWVPATFCEGIPPCALRVGTDANGDEIFAGRAKHGCDYLPAKVVPAKKTCYVAYGGKEVVKDEFEVLVPSDPATFTWQCSSNGAVPPNAVEIGCSSDGEKLYYGRVKHDGCVVTPGKIHPSHKTCYYPFNGEERRSDHYEALVYSCH